MHKLMPYILFSALVAAPNLRSSDSQLSFKGDCLGMSLADFCSKYYDPKPDGAAKSIGASLEFGRSFSEHDATDAPDNYRAQGIVLASKNSDNPPETIAGVPAESQFDFLADNNSDWDTLATWHRSDRASFEDFFKRGELNKYKRSLWIEAPTNVTSAASRFLLGQIDVRFSRESFNQVILALKERYGPSTKESIETLQNAMGATFESRHIIWIVGNNRIEAEERTTTIDHSIVRFESPTILKRLANQTNAAEARAAKDL